MVPRPAPDLDARRDRVVHLARTVAEAEGWSAVTMRRLAGELGVTQPVLYSAFVGRQALVDAVALAGFADLADALEAAEPDLLTRMRVYLDFAAAHPRAYESMFSLPTQLAFAVDDNPAALRRAFTALATVLPADDGTRAEVAWSTLHGLATLQAAGRLRPGQADDRLLLAHRLLSER
jgi:AcrR family transcriptional regulator